MLSESRNMPGLFLVLPLRPRPEAAWFFLQSAALYTKRADLKPSCGAFHISGLANPDNLAVQTNVRAKCWAKSC